MDMSADAPHAAAGAADGPCTPPAEAAEALGQRLAALLQPNVASEQKEGSSATEAEADGAPQGEADISSKNPKSPIGSKSPVERTAPSNSHSHHADNTRAQELISRELLDDLGHNSAPWQEAPANQGFETPSSARSREMDHVHHVPLISGQNLLAGLSYQEAWEEGDGGGEAWTIEESVQLAQLKAQHSHEVRLITRDMDAMKERLQFFEIDRAQILAGCVWERRQLEGTLQRLQAQVKRSGFPVEAINDFTWREDSKKRPDLSSKTGKGKNKGGKSGASVGKASAKGKNAKGKTGKGTTSEAQDPVVVTPLQAKMAKLGEILEDAGRKLERYLELGEQGRVPGAFALSWARSLDRTNSEDGQQQMRVAATSEDDAWWKTSAARLVKGLAVGTASVSEAFASKMQKYQPQPQEELGHQRSGKGGGGRGRSAARPPPSSPEGSIVTTLREMFPQVSVRESNFGTMSEASSSFSKKSPLAAALVAGGPPAEPPPSPMDAEATESGGEADGVAEGDSWTRERVERVAARGLEVTWSDNNCWDVRLSFGGKREPPLTEAAMGHYCQWLTSRFQALGDEHGPDALRQMRLRVDLSHCGIDDQMVWMFLEALVFLDVKTVVLKLFNNSIGHGGILAICEFIRASRQSEALRELHLSHNCIDGSSVLELLRTMRSCSALYPPRVSGEAKRVPVWVQVNSNRVEDPQEVLRMARAEGIIVCDARDRNLCGVHSCCQSGPNSPLVHLYKFGMQLSAPSSYRRGGDVPSESPPAPESEIRTRREVAVS